MMTVPTIETTNNKSPVQTALNEDARSTAALADCILDAEKQAIIKAINTNS
jgi:hypothetical protein